MIETMWPYLAIMLLAAGYFPRWRGAIAGVSFRVLPPIVLSISRERWRWPAFVADGEVQTAQRTRPSSCHALFC